MKRRPPAKTDLVELPARLRVFVAEDWYQEGDFDPSLPGAVNAPGHKRWVKARHEWLRARGINVLELFRQQHPFPTGGGGES